MNEFRVYYERHLPHYQPPDATLFITFRLAGSLPAHVIEQLHKESLHWRNGRVYNLLAYCIMPNHGHLVATPLRDAHGTPYALSTILQSLKRHTGRKANQLLGRHGAFWQHESYDHVVRDGEEMERIIDYVIKNPVRAKLVSNPQDWAYTYWVGFGESPYTAHS